MMEKLQRFGGAMFTPVSLFAFAGISVAITIIMQNPLIVGEIATEGTAWYSIWSILEEGAWTIFNQMELLFLIGLSIGLAKKAQGRAAMEALVVYLTFNYFVSGILQQFGPTFGVDFSQEVGGDSGLKMIAGIKTLDTNILGAIVIALIVVWLHDRYFEKKLPDWLGIFQGSAYVVILGFFVMIPMGVLTSWLWPMVQNGIASLQGFMANSGTFGVWIYIFLERLLIPTGLHHFVYVPFNFGPAIVEGGLQRFWAENMVTFAQSTESLKTLFPEGGFALHGNSKVFAAPGIALAFYFTARKENRKKVAALLIPVTLTAVLAGITEPLDFTFLFLAPALFVVHALLAATMSALMYTFGVVGDFGGGALSMMSKNWIPLFANHWDTYLIQFAVGLSFTFIYFILFRFLINKFNLKTPGREAIDGEAKLYTKKDYKFKKAQEKGAPITSFEGANQYTERALTFLDAFGGSENIASVTNCATRLRVTVKDLEMVHSDAAFKAGGAHGVVRNGRNFQVIVGLSVPQVREQFELLTSQGIKGEINL
ncbi:alpha-glucoside-specific PTS transporter subunit IIBC [Oceanobacillus caeni]|uniref:alpha-glucoside-specific PTS transporter subunit IIBC n=1 Tax=Oceanobacillus caeni TaxID=405946 RepID=UPI001956ED8D